MSSHLPLPKDRTLCSVLMTRYKWANNRRQMIECPSSSFFLSKKGIKLKPKTIWKRKRGCVCEVAGGDNTFLRICATWSQAQISLVRLSGTNVYLSDFCFANCTYSQVVAFTSATSRTFSFSISNTKYFLVLTRSLVAWSPAGLLWKTKAPKLLSDWTSASISEKVNISWGQRSIDAINPV